MNRQPNINGTFNLRDLGGYSTIDGRSTRWNVLFRAGNVNNLSASSQQQLTDYGVKTILDLRDEWEVEHYPNVFAQSSQVNYLNLPLIGDKQSGDETWKATTATYTSLVELYCLYLEGCRSQIEAIVTTIADQECPTLFHCHAGKDRSGIIAALLLGSLGVSNESIAEDYAMTTEQITHLIVEWHDYALQHGQDMEKFERDVASSPDTIFNMLDYIQQKYGTIADYLKTCGVTENHVTKLGSYFLS